MSARRRYDPLLLLAVMLMLAATGGSIVAAEWEAHTTSIFIVAALSALAGTALAYSSFAPLTAHCFAAVYGAFVVALIGGNHPQVAAMGEWRARVLFIIEALWRWVRALSQGENIRDAVVFIVVLSALLWALGYSATWQALRHQRVGQAILLLGTTLLANVYYYAGARNMAPFLAVFLLGALLGLGITQLIARATQWLGTPHRASGSLGMWVAAASVGMAFLSGVVGWRLGVAPPIPDSQAFLHAAREAVERLSQRLSTLQTSAPSTVNQPAERYEGALVLSGPRALSSALVMEVTAPPARYYWRATSFDFYDGRAWHNTQNTVLQPGAALRLPAYAARERVRATFRTFRTSDTFFTPGQPLGVAAEAQRLIESVGEGTAAVVQLRALAPIQTGSRYEAEGSVSRASISELRRASTRYPAWVMERYLQVPPQVPERVRDLAANITRGFTTPFDKAEAVERWLRENIAYDEALPEPPADIEASDYLLFHVRRGYCTYYATAMVMMLRSVGVPARLAVGYAQGTLLLDDLAADTLTYRVQARDSHTWVEVFFPEYGWVEFEPTAGQPPIPRVEEVLAASPEEAAPTATPTPVPTPTSVPSAAAMQPAPTSTPFPTPTLARSTPTPSRTAMPFALIGGVALLALLGGGAMIFRQGWQWVETRGLGGLPSVARAYGVMLRYAEWLGLYRAHYTPFEQAAALTRALPAIAPLITELTEQYVRYRFNAHHPAAPDADRWLPVMLPVLRQALRQRWAAHLPGHAALAALRTRLQRRPPLP